MSVDQQLVGYIKTRAGISWRQLADARELVKAAGGQQALRQRLDVLIVTGKVRVTPKGNYFVLLTPEEKAVAAHAKMLSEAGLPNKGTRKATAGHRRVTQCWRCGERLDNVVDLECCACGWIICKCGACGCGQQIDQRNQ